MVTTTKSQKDDNLMSGILSPHSCPCGFSTISLVELQDHRRAKDKRCSI